MLENPRKDVARPLTAPDLVKLAACCFRHAKIATNQEAAANLKEMGEDYLLKARRLDPQIRRPE
jgi:hypothetical protein